MTTTTTLRAALEEAKDLYEIGYARCFARWQNDRVDAESVKKEKRELFARIDAALAQPDDPRIIAATRALDDALYAMVGGNGCGERVEPEVVDGWLGTIRTALVEGRYDNDD
jgi:hypothetical protein